MKSQSKAKAKRKKSPVKQTGSEIRTVELNEEMEACLKRVEALERELASAKEFLRSVVETLEATNEELQSANEESTAVNDELKTRIQETAIVNNELLNLLSSIDIAVILIGSDLTLRRFTPKAQKFLRLMPGDVGLPFANIAPVIEIGNWQPMVLQVMADFRPQERELKDRAGIRYQLKILPYKTLENKVEGAVITIVAIAEETAGRG